MKTIDINNIAIIGLGLMGGSMALALKKVLPVTIFGIDNNPKHVSKAKALGLIDSEADLDIIPECDMVIIAIPVNNLLEVTQQVLDKISDYCIVFDTGSLKEQLCAGINEHPKRGNFIATHPIAGTEFSGPEAAIQNLFIGKKNIICDAHLTKKELLETALDVFKSLKMQTSFMNSVEHDKHIAYVSHLSHISSFMLGKTVLSIEKDEKNIFNMAGSGFASTVRLAKSSPQTWTPIFLENKANILKSLEEYIKNLKEFQELISTDNYQTLFQTIVDTNHIKEVLDKQ